MRILELGTINFSVILILFFLAPFFSIPFNLSSLRMPFFSIRIPFFLSTFAFRVPIASS